MKTLTLAVGFVLVAAFASAQDLIALTTPINPPAPPQLTGYQPVDLDVHPASIVDAHPYITVKIATNDGSQVLTFHYPDPSVPAFDTEAEVATLIAQLNTANLATRSLYRRICDRLVADFPTKFPGAVTVQ